MRISSRVKNLSASPIRKLAPYADKAAAQGKKIYHLNIGQPDILTPATFMEAVRAYDEPIIAYGNSKGEAALVKAIVNYYKDWGMTFPEEGVFITNGGSEALQLTVMALCDEGEQIMVFEPYYANYNTFAKQFNVGINAVATKAEEGYHLPPREVVEAAITPETKMLLVTNPGNPTGVVLTQAEMDMVAEIAIKYDLALVADEVYREFVYNGEFHSFGTIESIRDRLVIIDSVSKRYSACGARVGCIVTANIEFAHELMKLCQARLCCPVLEQVGAAALYTTPHSYLEEVNVEYKHRRDTIAQGLGAMKDVVASNPEGAFYVMVKFPVDDAEKFAIWLLEEFEIDGETVMFAPGNGFYVDPELGKREARLAYVLNCQDLERAMYILGEGLKAYPGAIK